MDAFAGNLRLPDGALPPAGSQNASDDVFIRLMGLHKGRNMLARAMRSVPSTSFVFWCQLPKTQQSVVRQSKPHCKLQSDSRDFVDFLFGRWI